MPITELKTDDKIALINLKRLWAEKANQYKITKSALAAKAGVSSGAISHVFKGLNPISYRVGVAAGELLRVPLSAINPKWGGEELPSLSAESLPNIPHFDRFQSYFDFMFEKEVQYDLVPCHAAKERYQQLMDNQGDAEDFFRELDFYSVRFDRPTLIASEGDSMILDAGNRDNPPRNKLTLWTWDGVDYNLGYLKKIGGDAYLEDTEASSEQHRMISLDKATYMGFVRAIQFT